MSGQLSASSIPRVCAQCGRVLDESVNDVGCLHCLVGELAADVAGETPRGENGSTRSFQHYEILLRESGQLWELGRGAMGVTYKALDTNLRLPVALKVIHGRHSAHPEARSRFLREARVAARLRHPNVASVFHYGTLTAPAGPESFPEPVLGLPAEEGARVPTCFYAMELVEGETLDARLRRTGPLAPTTAVEIALGIAAALEAAEKRGLIHRDLKPANVMLAADAEGEAAVKVIDFGLAKAVRAADAGELDEAGADGEPSTRGVFLGTLRFASPEQFDGRPLDSRADIYALGATLWTLLTGEPPHGGHTPAEVHDHQLHRPLPVARLARCRRAGAARGVAGTNAGARPGGASRLGAGVARGTPRLPDADAASPGPLAAALGTRRGGGSAGGRGCGFGLPIRRPTVADAAGASGPRPAAPPCKTSDPASLCFPSRIALQPAAIAIISPPASRRKSSRASAKTVLCASSPVPGTNPR